MTTAYSQLLIKRINLEIILADDGSPDTCPSMCDAWASKDCRIRVIHQENRGLSAAQNSGIKISAGELTGFVDFCILYPLMEVMFYRIDLSSFVIVVMMCFTF